MRVLHHGIWYCISVRVRVGVLHHGIASGHYISSALAVMAVKAVKVHERRRTENKD